MTFVEFYNPWALLLAVLVPPYLVVLMRRQATPALRYPSVHNLKRLPRTLRQRCRRWLPLLRGLAMLLLVVVIARPFRQLETQELPSEGIAILMLLDRSSSMGDEQNRMVYEGTLQLRFDVAKKVAREFIEGNQQGLAGRGNDLIGLTTFAGYPQANYPFTLFHPTLVNGLERMSPMEPLLTSTGEQTSDRRKAGIVNVGRGRREYRRNPLDGTRLRSAVEYGANQLISLGDDLARAGGGVQKYNLKSKIMVLLTDGEAERDFADPDTIKKLQEEDLKVYVVQILSGQQFRQRADGTIEVLLPDQTRRRNDISSLFGGGSFSRRQAAAREAQLNEAVDRARRLATATGGAHFLATTGEELEQVYTRIDELERSDVGMRTIFSREERYRPYLFAALALVAAELMLGLTWLRRVP